MFNGRDGEWRAVMTNASGKRCRVRCIESAAPQINPPDLWLLFAPLRKSRTDFVVEKATELGVAKVLPVRTEHTRAGGFRRDRLQAHAIAAAEQCGGTFVPPVAECLPLEKVLETWPEDRWLLFCDEARTQDPGTDFSMLPRGKWAILTGPEGGFSREEADRIAKLPQSFVAGLGPRVLRADTAVVAAIALWQDSLGDWRTGPTVSV